MRKLHFICLGLWLCGLFFGIARADTFQLNDGQSLTGELVSPNADGAIIRLPDDKYSDRVPWTKFSQEDLRKLSQNPKLAPLLEQYLEITQEEKMKRTEVVTELPPRLERPPARSLLAAMFSSGLGLFVVLLLYAANIYGAYEVAIFRGRPPGLLCGLAAIPLLGLACPIVFLSLPSRIRPAAEEEESQPASMADNPTFAVQSAPATAPGVPAAPAAPRGARRPPPPPASEPQAEPEPEPAAPGGLRIAHQEPAPSAANIPATQVFQRGAFMFNRRFFETKFPGFFGIVRRDADKDMLLVVKAARGEYAAERISRISANDFHVQVRKGDATEEIAVPFSEIKEIHLKHKDARG